MGDAAGAVARRLGAPRLSASAIREWLVKADTHEVPARARARVPSRGEEESALDCGESLLTLREVAGQLAVSPRTVRRLVAAGELRCVRIGRLIRVHPGDVSRWLSARKE